MIGLRRSGLSVPYLSIESQKGILTKGALSTFLPCAKFLKTPSKTGSIVLKISS